MRSLACLVCILGLGTAPVRSAEPTYFATDKATHTSLAVLVEGVPLLHTSQILPLAPQGKIQSPGKSAEQAKAVFAKLVDFLQAQKTSLEHTVKLNLYATTQEHLDVLRTEVQSRFSQGKCKPAVSAVLGKLPHADALVALDAIVALPTVGADSKAVTLTNTSLGLAGAGGAVLPSGSKVYVAGQAEKGADSAEATRKTLESLRSTLKHLKLGDEQVVQVKSFLNPMTDVHKVEAEMVKFFGTGKTPPLVFVEWSSSLPIEIELIAYAGPTEKQPVSAVEFITPPGMTASPIYSRVTKTHSSKLLYVSGLYADKGTSGADQVTEIFASLQSLTKEAKTDLKHLVKATYYVSNEEASSQLNKLRPNYYDPKRPPAASKAVVAGVGRAGKALTIDMIAVVP